ncbi:hypothetical protein PbDSM24746_21960 [Paenibacillus macerans]|nr:hypothetical protein PbDSM24746_21960 [Paenibacillus macerans]GBK68503.1 hypothetical protein PbJCM17693_22110 [Paenibacillus macerans]
MPGNLTFEDAATTKAGAETAWKALFTEGELQPGQTVLIHAAAGGVGRFRGRRYRESFLGRSQERGDSRHFGSGFIPRKRAKAWHYS